MRKHLNITTLKSLIVCSLIFMVSCDDKKENTSETTSENILLKEWTGPYGGVPAFDKMNLDDLKTALEIGMEKNLEDINLI
ncbi:MAG: M3 family peptidase, partial [Lutibacter sp.]|nr:M3 family peptidase [Lutibacter sp.]